MEPKSLRAVLVWLPDILPNNSELHGEHARVKAAL